MHRRSMRTAVVSVAAVAALTLAACGSKSQSGDTTRRAAPRVGRGQRIVGREQRRSSASGSASSAASGGGGELAIVPELQIDNEGAEVPVEAGGNAAQPRPATGNATCSGVHASPWRAR